jgi:hypothetical protein
MWLTAHADAMSRTCWSSQTAGQQVLQPVRPAMPGRLGDGPAVAVVQFHQQAVQHLAAGLAGLPPGEAPGDPPQQVRQQR